VGHVNRTVGSNRFLFSSDVSLLNPQGTRSLDDVKFYYTQLSGSTAASQTTTLPASPANVSIAVADVVKNVFGNDEQVGTIHLRSKDAAKLAVAATATSANTTAGSRGTSLPVFRTDRAAGQGEVVVLTGLRKDGTTRSDLFLQEMSGAAATVQTAFFGADGNSVSTRNDAVDANKLLQINDAVPAGAVSAVITNNSTNGAKLQAYAQLVDTDSGDTWIAVDWARQLGYAASSSVVVPIAGTLHGANGTLYRSDVAVTNRGTTTATGTLRFTPLTGTAITKPISLGPRQTQVMSNVINTTLGITTDSVGFITVTPTAGTFAVGSRTYTTTTGKSGSFSTEVPVAAGSVALGTGGSLSIPSLQEADRRTLPASRPGTFRTNLVLAETAGRGVVVRATLQFTFAAGAKAQGIGSATRDFPLSANQFMLVNSIADQIIGPDRLQFKDLKGVQADFQVISGDGAVTLFTSTVDNATGDSIIRMQ
jgi:hypothetical protein